MYLCFCAEIYSLQRTQAYQINNMLESSQLFIFFSNSDHQTICKVAFAQRTTRRCLRPFEESGLMQSAFNGTKAAPETSTTPANASGILDSSLNSLTIKDQQQQNQTDSTANGNTRPRARHSYSIILLSLLSSNACSWK